MKSDASVASWKEVAELLKKLKPELAKEVEDLIKQYAATPYRLNGVLKSKPFYKELAATYLPKLRKVQYTYGYSIFRSLTDDEIRELYRKNPKQLTRFEYYRMITTAKLPTKGKSIAGKLLNFMITLRMQPMNWQWQRYRKILRIHVFSNRLSVNRHRRSYCPIGLLPCCMKGNIQKQIQS